MRNETENVTNLLVAWSDGDAVALEQLMAIVYQELRRIANYHLAHERPNHTLDSAALVNEAYIRIIDQRHVSWQNRAHFFAIAARLMRRILVDYARARVVAKRGGNAVKVDSDSAAAMSVKTNSAVQKLLQLSTTSVQRPPPPRKHLMQVLLDRRFTLEEYENLTYMNVPDFVREKDLLRFWGSLSTRQITNVGDLQNANRIAGDLQAKGWDTTIRQARQMHARSFRTGNFTWHLKRRWRLATRFFRLIRAVGNHRRAAHLQIVAIGRRIQR